MNFILTPIQWSPSLPLPVVSHSGSSEAPGARKAAHVALPLRFVNSGGIVEPEFTNRLHFRSQDGEFAAVGTAGGASFFAPFFLGGARKKGEPRRGRRDTLPRRSDGLNLYRPQVFRILLGNTGVDEHPGTEFKSRRTGQAGNNGNIPVEECRTLVAFRRGTDNVVVIRIV